MSNLQSVSIDNLRSIDHTGISGSYAVVGGPLAEPVRLICFTNNTDGDLFVSDDGVNNKLFLAAGSFKLFDLNSNRYGLENQWVFAIGTQFYVKQSTAPSKNAFYIECLWGQ